MMIQFKIYERKDSKWVSRPNLSRKFKNEDEMVDYLKVNLKMDNRSPEHKFKYTIKYLRGGNKMNNELQPKQAIWGKKKSGNEYQDILFGSTVLTLVEKNDKWGYFTYDDGVKSLTLALEDVVWIGKQL